MSLIKDLSAAPTIAEQPLSRLDVLFVGFQQYLYQN